MLICNAYFFFLYVIISKYWEDLYNMQNYNLAFAITKNHLLYFYIVLASVIKNNKDKIFTAYLMHNDCLKSEDLKYFEMIMEKEHLSISYKIILVNMQENYDYCEMEKNKKR